MFHVASAASVAPARKPIRGSGLGGDADAWTGAVPAGELEVEEAHAAAANSRAASERVLLADVMECSSVGTGAGA
jgi:hypothetical protein